MFHCISSSNIQMDSQLYRYLGFQGRSQLNSYLDEQNKRMIGEVFLDYQEQQLDGELILFSFHSPAYFDPSAQLYVF